MVTVPIHTSWKSMVKSMKASYKAGKTKCRKFTDGAITCMSKKAWSVFYATLNKHGWKDTKPRPKSVTETVFLEAVEKTMTDLVHWYEETLCGCSVGQNE